MAKAGEHEERNGAKAGSPDFPARAIYRALLVRGLEPSEAANLTAWLAGLPCNDIHWTIGEVDDIVRRRLTRRAKSDPADGPTIRLPLSWQSS